MHKPLLSLCLIIRDAAKTIEALLDTLIVDGKPVADEFVFVDTGSVDDTKVLIQAALKKVLDHGDSWYVHEGGGEGLLNLWPNSTILKGHTTWEARSGKFRVVLAHFPWVDDFSAARNYSFSLAEGVWRGYLDSDDLLVGGAPLLKLVAGIEARVAAGQSRSNCISMSYDYQEGEVLQQVIRVVRWEEGWRWRGEIHEALLRYPEGPKGIAMEQDTRVVHSAKRDVMRSLERNIRICSNLRQQAQDRGDYAKVALMSHYLGNYALSTGRVEEGLYHLEVSAQSNPGINLRVYALVELARFELDRGNGQKAKEYAGRAIAQSTQYQEGFWVLGLAFYALKDPAHAVDAFETAWARPPLLASTQDDKVLEGIARATAALAYLDTNQIPQAQAMLAAVPKAIESFPMVFKLSAEARRQLTRLDGLAKFRALFEYYLMDTQPDKALLLLENAPAAISDHPEIEQMRRWLNKKMTHMESWNAYREAYAAIPGGTYHTNPAAAEFVPTLGRAQAMVKWAKENCGRGPLRACSIGFLDGLMEVPMLEANPDLQLWVADVAPQANQGLEMLQARFPGRVHSKAMEKHHYDWPEVEGGFDLVMMFEVLEHLPSDRRALALLGSRMKPTGTLLLSTPVADAWVETCQIGASAPANYWHVRAHNPSSLWHLVQLMGFEGRLEATENGFIFLATLRLGATWGPSEQGSEGVVPPRDWVPHWNRPKVSILVPDTSQPFDPDTLSQHHLGGSEEAVVHLSAALARRGYQVTVYAPRSARTDGVVVHAQEGVFWRTPKDFDSGGDHEQVLVWRTPEVAYRLGKTRYQKLLWCHDTHHGVPRELYQAADQVLVLSQTHAATVTQGDGFEGPFTQVKNGIDLAAFPELTEADEAARGPHRLIYASAPDRGLLPLLEVWPDIRKAVPDATLDVYYLWPSQADLDKRPDLKDLLTVVRDYLHQYADEGVTHHGGVSHQVLHAAYRRAGVWAYFPTTFKETFCISALKAQASGCWPVASNAGALPEVLHTGDVLPVEDAEATELFASMVIQRLLQPPDFETRKVMSERVRALYGWDKVAEDFIRAFKKVKGESPQATG